MANEEKQRLLWFQDNAKMKSARQYWQRVDNLTGSFVSLINPPFIEHSIIDPVTHIQRLFDKLSFDEFSAVIDLSGFLQTPLRDRGVRLPIIDQLHFSRLRAVSSPGLESVGYTLSVTPGQVTWIKDYFDLSNPLLVDDVGWSGQTALDTTAVLGVDSSKCTFGFLALNTGIFKDGDPGCAQLLDKYGARAIGGCVFTTPSDDGFHLENFYDNPFINTHEGMDTVIRIQKLREVPTALKGSDRKKVSDEIQEIFKAYRRVLFPNSVSAADLAKRTSEGIFWIKDSIGKDGYYTANPPNWLLPTFAQYVNSAALKTNITRITDLLSELNSLLNSNTTI